MLTFLSRSFRRLFDTGGRRAPEPQLSAVAQLSDLSAELARLRGAWQRAQLRAAEELERCDMPVALPPPTVGATAFVAGQGARIYSLEVFRQRRSPRPPTHSAA